MFDDAHGNSPLPSKPRLAAKANAVDELGGEGDHRPPL
jgi:hypothetical protein